MSGNPNPEWLAAGTDLMERRRSGVSPEGVHRVVTTEAMRTIGWHADGSATVGASLTIAALAEDQRIAAAYPGLTAAAAGLATPEIRRMATVGGNLAQKTRCWYFRNPHIACLKKGGTTCPARAGNHLYGIVFDLGSCVAPHPSTLGAALLAYEAHVTTDQRAEVSVSDVLGDGRDGRRDHALQLGELITTMTLPTPKANERAIYRRAISRAYAEWPLVEIIIRIVPDVAGRIVSARVVVGGVAAVPLRLSAVESLLEGAAMTAVPLAAIQTAAVQNAQPLPLTGYKLQLLQGLLADGLSAIELGTRS